MNVLFFFFADRVAALCFCHYSLLFINTFYACATIYTVHVPVDSFFSRASLSQTLFFFTTNLKENFHSETWLLGSIFYLRHKDWMAIACVDCKARSLLIGMQSVCSAMRSSEKHSSRWSFEILINQRDEFFLPQAIFGWLSSLARLFFSLFLSPIIQFKDMTSNNPLRREGN